MSIHPQSNKGIAMCAHTRTLGIGHYHLEDCRCFTQTHTCSSIAEPTPLTRLPLLFTLHLITSTTIPVQNERPSTWLLLAAQEARVGRLIPSSTTLRLRGGWGGWGSGNKQPEPTRRSVPTLSWQQVEFLLLWLASAAFFFQTRGLQEYHMTV